MTYGGKRQLSGVTSILVFDDLVADTNLQIANPIVINPVAPVGISHEKKESTSKARKMRQTVTPSA
ncbi:MAG: hypothetical protein AAF558_08245, partial [Verrucomicrobiota bacterium]